MLREHRQRASTIRHPETVSLGRRSSGELTEDTLHCLSLLAVRHQKVANIGRCSRRRVTDSLELLAPGTASLNASGFPFTIGAQIYCVRLSLTLKSYCWGRWECVRKWEGRCRYTRPKKHTQKGHSCQQLRLQGPEPLRAAPILACYFRGTAAQSCAIEYPALQSAAWSQC